MHVVLLETAGNQRYIFATNKLRENVGASELTYRAGTQLVLEAVKDAGGPDLWDDDPQALRDHLAHPDRNGPIERPGARIEVVVATSGKAILLVRDAEAGRRVIREVTRKVIEEAPGLDLRGVIVAAADAFEAGTVHDAVRRAHDRLEALRSRLPGPGARFARLPVVEECATSGLPASRYDAHGREAGEDGPRSDVSMAKRGAVRDGLERMGRIVGGGLTDLRLCKDIDEIERGVQGLDWLAVIHADGNGLGRIFLNFDQYVDVRPETVGGDRSRAYVEQLRAFSLALEECTETAFREALLKLHARLETEARRERTKEGSFKRLPVIPLVLGGDDLTVLCDGRRAMDLTHDFLVAFEAETERPNDHHAGIIPRIAARAFAGTRRLSSCAGVAIVKPHYPFHAAYELAEDLLQSGKSVKRVVRHHHNDAELPCSALDFHLLHDASGSDLDRVRKRLRVDYAHRDGDPAQRQEPTTVLFSRPYVVTDRSRLTGLEPSARAWVDHHHWSRLEDRVRAIRSRGEDGRRKLPNSMLHELREGLFGGREEADFRLQLVHGRYEAEGIDHLTVPGRDGRPSLFWNEADRWYTGLLDALDAAEFLVVEGNR